MSSVPSESVLLRLFEILIGNNSSRHTCHTHHHQNIIPPASHFHSRHICTIFNPLHHIPSLHSNLPAAIFAYCIRSYRICAPSVPATLTIVPYTYPLICLPHQCYSYKSTSKFLPDPHIACIMCFTARCINQVQMDAFAFIIHLITLLDSQIRGCRASGGVLRRFESHTRHVMLVYIL